LRDIPATADGLLTMRFVAIHSGPLLNWHATTIRRLLELPGAIFVGRREVNGPRTPAGALAMLGYSPLGTMLDESDVNRLPPPSPSEEILDCCVAFDARAAASAPQSRMGTLVFDVDGAQTTPGLNAFCESRDIVEARLLLIDDAGVVTCLRSGALGVNRFSLSLTIEGLLDELARWPAAVMLQAEDGLLNSAPAPPPSVVREPTFAGYASAAAMLMLRRAAAIIEKRFFTFSWNSGIVSGTPAQIARSSSLPPVAWCEAGRRRFFADPFGATIDGVLTAFCEEIDPVTNLGEIVRLVVVDGRLVPAERVLAERYHLSYPYVFEHDGSWFAIPESSQNDEVALYRLENSGREWRKHVVLLPNVCAVDSTVFFHQGKYWLLCGLSDDGPNHKLYVYHADTLIGPWRPHPCNPVKIDIRSARPAGAPFLIDGMLHRPAQDCTRKYGRRLAIVRVNAIDERRYEEETVAVIEPPRGTYSRGMHTLSAMGAYTLVDGLRRDFSLRAAGRRTIRSIRRLYDGRAVSNGLDINDD